LTAEIAIADGTRFVTAPDLTADALVKSFERRSFALIELEGGSVYLNPAHVAYVRDLEQRDRDPSASLETDSRQ
jgi:hypothetical protein